MSARVYFMKTVNDCKDVSIISPQDEQWRRTIVYSVCILYACSQNIKKTNCKQSRQKSYGLQLSQ